MTHQTKHTFCRICESLCGLEVQVKDNEVVGIQPDKDHVTTYGFACPKGLKQHKMYATADRLKYPMVKRDGVVPLKIVVISSLYHSGCMDFLLHLLFQI